MLPPFSIYRMLQLLAVRLNFVPSRICLPSMRTSQFCTKCVLPVSYEIVILGLYQ